LDEVANRREHVTITRHGRPSAVLVPVDEYAALEETAEILSDEGTLEAIRQGLDDIAVDDVVALDQLREDVARRSAS
jgi:prevent-host-death family protein